MRRTEPGPDAAAGGGDILATWLLTDGRPGHEAQLRGLAQAISRRQPTDLRWVKVADRRVSWLDLLRGHYPDLAHTPAPRLAIAAGHGTHRELLALGRASACMTCVLMRPSLPLWCFDAAIIPRHDGPPQNARVLATSGVLNPIAPASSPDETHGLIMLGGPSRHFDFPLDRLCHQVASLCAHFPAMRWTATTSRRTPEGVAGALRARGAANLQVVDHNNTGVDWVEQMLGQCSQAWITEDSVSMVYEALTAGIATGVIPLPAARAGRLQRGLGELHRTGMLNRLEDVLAGRHPEPPAHPLQEADRAAEWLLRRLRPGGAA